MSARWKHPAATAFRRRTVLGVGTLLVVEQSSSEKENAPGVGG